MRPETRLRLAWAGMQATGRVSRRLGGRFAARLWFTPAPASATTGAGRAGRPPGAVPLQLRAAGGTLAAWEAGAGPTVLLVHGWGERGATMAPFVPALVDAGFRAVGFDLPGHGDSPAGATDLYALAATLRSVATEVSAEAVVAHSMGALTTLVACRDALAPRALVLVAPAVRLEHALEPFRRQVRAPRRAVEGLRARIEERFGPDVWEDVAGDLIAPQVTVPALVLHDAGDRQVDVRDAERLVAAWPHARLTTTRGLGHVRILSDPAVVAAAVTFLATQLQDRATSVPPTSA